MAPRVNHVGIVVPSLEKAAKFFHEVFGVGTSAVESPLVKNLYLKFENFTLQICEDPARLGGAQFGRLDHIAFDVDDLDETQARLKEHGIYMVWDPHAGSKTGRANFTTDKGGVGVQFQLADKLGDRGGQEFRAELMEAVARKEPAKK